MLHVLLVHLQRGRCRLLWWLLRLLLLLLPLQLRTLLLLQLLPLMPVLCSRGREQQGKPLMLRLQLLGPLLLQLLLLLLLLCNSTSSHALILRNANQHLLPILQLNRNQLQRCQRPCMVPWCLPSCILLPPTIPCHPLPSRERQHAAPDTCLWRSPIRHSTCLADSGR